MKKTLFNLLTCLLIVSSTQATTYLVSTTGASSGSSQPYTLSYAYSLATNGDILLLDAGTYTDAIVFPTSNSITIKGNPGASSMPVLNFALGTPTGPNGTLIFDGVTIDRGSTSSDFFTPGTITASNNGWSIKFQNCQIKTMKSLINTGTTASTNSINTVLIDNCILSNTGVSGTGFVYLSVPVQNVTIKNSTFYYVASSDLIKSKNGTTANTPVFSISNNNFYKSLQGGSAIYSDYQSTGYPTGTAFNFVNNMLDLPVPSGTKAAYLIWTKNGSGTVSEYKNIYIGTWNAVDSWGDSFNGGSVTFNTRTNQTIASVFSGATTLPYYDASTGNFYLGVSSPAATAGYNASQNGITYPATVGDPRWLQTPAITPGSSNVTGIDYNLNTSTATVQSFTLNVALPGSQVTVTAPTDYEISSSASTGFGSSLILGTKWFNLSTTIYVRMKAGLSAGSYNGENISIAATGITTQYVSCSGSVTSLSSLSAPTGLGSSSVSYTSFLASWNSVANATGYQVKVYDGATLVSTTSGISGNSSTISGLSQSTSYTFKVVAVGDGSNYSNSDESSASGSFTTQTLTLTTSINTSGAGTVNKSADLPYTVGQNVNLIAIRNFGYQFEKWVDAANGDADLSTANPYTVTLSESKNIKAVFTAVSTYNFTVNKAGAGANWGSVTVSPAPMGGKEETGASVTMTPVSNIVSTFSHWDDASTGVKTVTVSGDASYTATFTANPFIAAWDFPTTNIVKDRAADYYSNSSNQSVMRLLKVDGTSENWTFNTFSGKNGMKRWTSAADFNNNTCRSFQVEFSSRGFKNICVNSKVLFRDNLVNKVQKLQFSTDGTNFTDINTLDLSGHTNDTWYDFNGTLPSSADNKSTLYIRWTGDVTSGLLGDATGKSTEEFHLTSVVISGTPLITSSNTGDFVATTSGDFNSASNWSISGSSGWGITGTAPVIPSSSDNIWIPSDITMTTTSSVTCKDLNIRGKFTASNEVTVAGNLTIKSDVNGTGTLLGNNNIAVTGTSSVEQYLTSGRNWYLSSPISNASYTNLTTTSNVTFWNEPISAWVQNYTGSLAVGRGYISTGTNASQVIVFSGSLNDGNVDIPLTRQGGTYTGFNLVGNPYPSYLNAMTAINNNPNLEPTIWYRTKGINYVYETVNTTSGLGTNNTGAGAVSGLIPPMQAFWVKTNADAQILSFGNTMRLHATESTTLLRTRTSTINEVLRLQLINNQNTDEAVVYFNKNASNDFDKYDSQKMSNDKPSTPEIYTISGNEKLAINGLGDVNTVNELPLGFSTVVADTFSIKATEISNFEDNVHLILKDNLLNKETDLTAGEMYSFTSDAGNSSSRFSIVFRAAGVAAGNNCINTQKDNYVFENGNLQIGIYCKEAGFKNAQLSVYNAIGQKIADRMLQASTSSLAVSEKGMYLVQFIIDGMCVSKKIIIK